ncbi:hypothetical protein D3C71_942250 [compost metagenome]
MLAAQSWPVSVVIEEGYVRPPTEPHLKLGGQQKTDGHLECFGPCLGRSNRAFRPIVQTHHLRHLAIANEYVVVPVGNV